MRFHYMPITKARTLTTSDAGKDVEQEERSFIASENATRTDTWEQFWQFLANNIFLPYDPAINPKELKTHIDTKLALECL